jgi:hypothetical protein
VVIRLDLQVDMAVFWISGKDGLEAVVASGLSTLGAALENRESMFEVVFGNGDASSMLTAHELHLSPPQWQRVSVMNHDVVHR